MSSLIYSILKFHDADDLSKVMDFAVNEVNEFDFNMIKTIPEGLKVEHSPYQDAAIASYYNTLEEDEQKELIDNLKDKHYVNVVEIAALAAAQEQEQILVAEERIDLGQQYYDNILEFGYPDFLEWTSANWHTKGNAMDTVVDTDKLEIRFKNAGNAAGELMNDLFEKTQVPFIFQHTNDDFSVYGETSYSKDGIEENAVGGEWVAKVFDVNFEK